MLKLGSIRFRSKCSRHPKFNPARDGLPAIKGGCPKCHLLLDIYETHHRLVELMRKAVPPRENGTKLAADAAQLGLFVAVEVPPPAPEAGELQSRQGNLDDCSRQH